jgi:hypothetical protein
MEKRTVIARVPGKDGNPDLVGQVEVDWGETASECIKSFGDEPINSNAFANYRVTVQSRIRSLMKKGVKPEELQPYFNDAKPGVAISGGKIDPQAAFLAKFKTSTKQEQAAMLAELKAAAAAAAAN